jgi:hypothetical protein
VHGEFYKLYIRQIAVLAGSIPDSATRFVCMNANQCQCLADFMKAQRDIIARHLEEHKYLRHIDDKEKAVGTFIEDYGWLIREMYCVNICNSRTTCEIAQQLSASGDLLRNHVKQAERL